MISSVDVDVDVDDDDGGGGGDGDGDDDDDDDDDGWWVMGELVDENDSSMVWFVVWIVE